MSFMIPMPFPKHFYCDYCQKEVEFIRIWIDPHYNETQLWVKCHGWEIRRDLDPDLDRHRIIFKKPVQLWFNFSA